MTGFEAFGMFLYDLLVPHFVTEWVASDIDPNTGEAIPIVSMQYFEPEWEPEPDVVVKITSLAWLLNAWNWGQDRECMTYREWCEYAERQEN